MSAQHLIVAVIGCGSLGTAITGGILDIPSSRNADSNIRVSKIIATVNSVESQLRAQSALRQWSDRLIVRLAADNVDAMGQADVVILSTKPGKRSEIFTAPSAREALRGKLVLSIMGGISTASLHNAINGNGSPRPDDAQVVRIMPNLASRIRQAMSLATFAPDRLSPANQAIAEWVFRQVGDFKWAPESTFDIASVLVGCSGSLIMLALDGLLDAAVAEGLKRNEAQELVVKSTLGLVSMLTPEAGGHPSLIRETISSPGGNSIRALLELEDRGVRAAFTAAIMKASARSRELSQM